MGSLQTGDVCWMSGYMSGRMSPRPWSLPEVNCFPFLCSLNLCIALKGRSLRNNDFWKGSFGGFLVYFSISGNEPFIIRFRVGRGMLFLWKLEMWEWRLVSDRTSLERERVGSEGLEIHSLCSPTHQPTRERMFPAGGPSTRTVDFEMK